MDDGGIDRPERCVAELCVSRDDGVVDVIVRTRKSYVRKTKRWKSNQEDRE